MFKSDFSTSVSCLSGKIRVRERLPFAHLGELVRLSHPEPIRASMQPVCDRWWVISIEGMFGQGM